MFDQHTLGAIGGRRKYGRWKEEKSNYKVLRKSKIVCFKIYSLQMMSQSACPNCEETKHKTDKLFQNSKDGRIIIYGL